MEYPAEQMTSATVLAVHDEKRAAGSLDRRALRVKGTGVMGSDRDVVWGHTKYDNARVYGRSRWN